MVAFKENGQNKCKLLFVLLFIMALFTVLVLWKPEMDVWSFFYTCNKKTCEKNFFQVHVNTLLS